jgi:hypothetical protein
MRAHTHASVSLGLISLIALSPPSLAQPVYLNEVQRITVPAPYFSAEDVCLRGDDLLVLTTRPESGPNVTSAWTLIHLRRQAGGEWLFMREVAAVAYNADQDIWSNEDLACAGSLAAFSTPEGASYAVELTASGWQATRLAGLDRGSAAAVQGDAVAIAGSWRGPTTVAVVRKNASGAWTNITYAEGNDGGRSNSEFTGPSRAWVGATEIGADGLEYEPPGQIESVSDTQIFDLLGGSWRLTQTLPFIYEGAVINNRLALRLDMWTEPGEIGAYFIRDASGDWTEQHSLLSDEHTSHFDAVFPGERAFARASAANSGVIGEILLFNREAPRRYRHVATLGASDAAAAFFGGLGRFSVDGEWVAATARGFQASSDADIYLFRAPSALPARQRLQKTFEDNSTADWSFSGITDWRIVTSDGSRVFRQLNLQGDARAILETSQGTNQSIQADVRINELGAGTPWAGLVLRYTDTQNFYYLLVNRTSIQIRKIVNGAFGPIATAPHSLVLGRRYRFRLEAIGSRLRAFVNDQQVAEVIDAAHAQGRAGLTMYRARTDYDNVIVTSSPQTDLFVDGTFGETQRPWRTIAPANAWSVATLSNGERVYRQSLISGGPRTVNGGPTGDQSVKVTVRPTAFNTSNNGWVGVMARYVDNFNNYYAMLHQNGRASLRKRVNGTTTVIEEVPFTVTRNTAYRVRLEAIGSTLRFYVNGRLLAEGQANDLPTGRYGLVTSNATADFDDFSALRP